MFSASFGDVSATNNSFISSFSLFIVPELTEIPFTSKVTTAAFVDSSAGLSCSFPFTPVVMSVAAAATGLPLPLSFSCESLDGGDS